MKKFEATIVYLSGEHYTIKNVRNWNFQEVTGNGYSLERKEAPQDPDKPSSKILISYYESSRKADIVQSMPTAGIEVLIVRERGGNSLQAFRLHRQRNPSNSLFMSI